MDVDALFRPAVQAIAGYVPGEQPKTNRLIKLNTNENPYPLSPKAASALAEFASASLNRYPDPFASGVRAAAAELFEVSPDWIIAGNGSDDILTITVRSFLDAGDEAVCLGPSYSLYPVLTAIQGANCRQIALPPDFSLPSDLIERIGDARLFLLANPNAPTGNRFSSTEVAALCEAFSGIVLIDEAYADFSPQNCSELAKRFDNVIISRTLSKGYGLAGVRLGYAMANPRLIAGMMKVKDSYNVNALSQVVGEAALRDQEWLSKTREKVLATRKRTATALQEMGFVMTPSAANFLFVKPPMSAAAYFEKLREEAIIIRYFPQAETRDWVRISIGTDEEMTTLLSVTRTILGLNH
jgi:histidinol-phosphate aminotransferase